MIDQVELMAIATGAAGSIVANMLASKWRTTRDAAAQLFGHGSDAEHESHLARLEGDRERLLKDTSLQDALTERWARRLALFVEDHPDALAQLRQIGPSTNDTGPGSVKQNASDSTGNVVQIGRDAHGEITLGGRE